MKAGFWLFSAVLLAACLDGSLRFYVVFHQRQGLDAGSPVWLKDKRVGEVENVSREKNGDWKVAVKIARPFRRQVTNGSRFYIEPDPDESGRYRLRIVPDPRGDPIVEGQVVEGSEPLADFLRPLLQGLGKGLGELERQLEWFHRQLDRLPQSSEYLELQRQMEELARQMREAEKTLQYQTLPKLQREMERLQRELEKALPRPRPGERSPRERSGSGAISL